MKATNKWPKLWKMYFSIENAGDIIKETNEILNSIK